MYMRVHFGGWFLSLNLCWFRESFASWFRVGGDFCLTILDFGSVRPTFSRSMQNKQKRGVFFLAQFCKGR